MRVLNISIILKKARKRMISCIATLFLDPVEFRGRVFKMGKVLVLVMFGLIFLYFREWVFLVCVILYGVFLFIFGNYWRNVV